MSNYIQGPIFPRTNTSPGLIGGSTYDLPYILKSTSGITCDAEEKELFISTPYVTGINGTTADAFSKIFVTNDFGNPVFPLRSKNIISGFMPEFYIGSPTEVKSTWTPFRGSNYAFDGLSASNYEVMSVVYSTTGFTATVNGTNGFVTAITGVTLEHSIRAGNDNTVTGSGMYRKLGKTSLH
tara:strand:+ start:3874 stop:4419 length:546 start_codon:yes stop_codon:yes gene_type:complete